ncbi:SPOR domain-containing protein [Noviherbaspirillum galbum]|uniref:SPOR domain-containing protein n=1 Tax=Noviherbaspirillum galbum TaxID=2709383 RepID=A0A6B3SWD9_9BURK|nr:SPOR domain-containing protein [Noviherbaspirillum galbum]NEX63266.1 SPOR domain-containing protein [Noviherbaspirillum galbum]
MKTRQQGGTVIGIIIGLVIGLGIALAVAMMITKTPMPFTDKSGKQTRLDPTPNQISDPNKPLYGNKAAAKDAAKDLGRGKEAEPPVNTAAPQPEKKADPKEEARIPATAEPGSADKLKKAEPKAAEVKIGDTKEAQKDPAKADDEKWNYYLQAGAFRDQGDAEGMRAKLALIGVEAKVSERQSDSGLLYRVRVGPFGQMDAMNKVRGKLSDNSIDAAVVRVAK